MMLKVSKNYTCHGWARDTGRLLVCNDIGDIFVMNYTGELLFMVNESPKSFHPGPGAKIHCIIPFPKGFVVAVSSNVSTEFKETECEIWSYLESSSEKNDRVQYKLLQRAIGHDTERGAYDHEFLLPKEEITTMALVSTEDLLYFITKS